MYLSRKHLDIVEDYYENGLSQAELSRKYDYDIVSIRKSLAAYAFRFAQENNGCKRERKIVPKPSCSVADRRPLSTSHSAIGLHLTRYMNRHGLEARELGMLLKPMKSTRTINKAVMGLYDWTLFEMQGLTTFLDLSMEELTSITKEVELAVV
ncbi:MAG: hypothetical protein ACK4FG_02065 [Brevundimonas sp.]